MTSFASNWTKSFRINRHCAQLEQLTDRQLKDIGVERKNIRDIVSRAVSGQ